MTMYETFVASIKKCSHHNVIRPVRLTEGEEQEIQVHREWLVAAWVFSFSVIFISAYIVMLYSLKFGKNKSLRWLSSLVLAELLDILLFTPIKIFLIAMLLSASFERSTDNLTFKLDVQKATKSDLVGNQEYLDELLKKREASTYNPMTDKVKAEKRRAAIRRMKWRLFCDFVAVATFILVLCYIVSILWSSAHYHPNHHAGNIVMTTFHGRFVALHDVFNRTLFLSYLENTFVRSLFTFRWFNNLKFETLSPQGNSSNITERKDWTKDYVSKLMGAPRLRQLRVVHNLCTTYQMRLMAIEECIKPWDPSYMDTEVYGIRWRKAELEDELAYSWGHRTSWMYHLAKNTSVFPLPGKSGIVYPSGGYILPLTVKRDTSRSYALSVRQDNWIDQRSRGIFLEFTLYNVNTNLFSQVTAIVEQMSSGLFMPTVFVQSVHTYGDWSVMNVIYVIFIVILFIEIAYNINRNGLLNFSLKFLHVYEVVVIIVGILSVVFYLIHVKVSTFYVDDFRRTGQDQFFKFSDMIKYFLYTRVLLWILFCLLVFRLFFSWYFGPAYVFYYRTFVLSKREIAIFVVALFFYFYIIWRYIGYTIDAAVFYNYQVNILHYKMYTHIHYRTSLTRTRRLAMALCFLALFFKLMYFVVFMHYYLIAKRKKLFPMHHLNFIEFLIYETKKASGKIKEEQPTSDRQIHRKRDM